MQLELIHLKKHLVHIDEQKPVVGKIGRSWEKALVLINKIHFFFFFNVTILW